jgi:hypothetical protein
MVIADIHAAGMTSLSGIARALQARGIKTAAGKEVWQARQVSRLLRQRRRTRPLPNLEGRRGGVWSDAFQVPIGRDRPKRRDIKVRR